MAPAPPGNPIAGLLLAFVLMIFALWSIRRSSKKRPAFHACPICKENVQFSLGFQGGKRDHFKTAHPEYWRLLRKWVVIESVIALTAMISIFPLLIYNIIPSRGPPSILTPIGIAVWAAVTFSALGVAIAHGSRIRRHFRQEWSEKHPLYQRTYGNLRGIEVEIKPVGGKTRTAIVSAAEFLFNPIAPVLTQVAAKFIERRVRRSRLDKFENDTLWFYNGLDQLVSWEVKNLPTEIVDEQRIRISLKNGRIDLRTETSADLSLALSIINPVRVNPLDPSR